MISVCIATYNGAKYIKEQIESILFQLSESDEIIISDDSSTDKTIKIIESLNDKRIKIIESQKFKNPIFNFENAINHAKGDIIFLSDQDDVWLPNKVSRTLELINKHDVDLLVSNCSVVDKELQIIHHSYFELNGINADNVGLMKSFFRNPYLGCCMAFRKNMLKRTLPFPSYIPMHDIWIGLIATAYHKVLFTHDILMLYRRHGNNATPYTASGKSRNSILKKISFRLKMVRGLLISLFR